jgi:hypothetical protein
VVGAHDRGHQATEAQGLDDRRAADRVTVPLDPLVVAKRAGCGQDRLGNAHLAHVMEHCPVADGLDFRVQRTAQAGQAYRQPARRLQ